MAAEINAASTAPGYRRRDVVFVAGRRLSVIDLLSLGLTHALLMIAAWRLVRRPDLDRELGEAAGGTKRDA